MNFEEEHNAFEKQLQKDDEKWREIIALVDKNGDGKVQKEEFQTALLSYLD